MSTPGARARAAWENLTPGRKRAIVAGGTIVGLATMFALVDFGTGGPALEAQQTQRVRSIMVEDNTRQVTMDALAATNQRLEQRLNQLEQQIAAERRREETALQQQADRLRAEMRSAQGQQLIALRNQLGATEARLLELSGRVGGARAPAPAPADVAPTAAMPLREPEPIPTAPTAPEPARAPARPAPAEAAPDLVSFGASPPVRAESPRPAAPAAPSTAAPATPPRETEPPPAPAGPFGDLSPGALFGGTGRAGSGVSRSLGPAVPGSPAAQPVAASTGGPSARPPAVPTAGQIRFIAPAPPVERENAPARTNARNEAFIPAGAILSGVILAGFDAPTGRQARRDPLPALIRVTDLAILPNRFRADVRECFLLVSGFGDLSSERAYMRGESLSCVLSDGTAVQERLQGYASGEDGKAGVRGRLVQRQGEFVGRAILVGVMQGVAQAFQGVGRSGVSVIGAGASGFSLDGLGDSFGGGLALGGARALDRIAQFYLQQAGDLFPVIEVSAGRQVDVILTSGATLRLPNRN
jgi:conjugal transfer pilus assembly protein TraB